MIDLYFWPTGNGKKIVILLEEAGIPYRFKPVNIGRGDQFDPDYLKIAPNNRMPPIGSSSTMAGIRLLGAAARRFRSSSPARS